MAVSPTTRDFKRFLYAVDGTQGSIMVYDVTDPIGGPHVPLTRPHPALDPFQPPDRILFGAPVKSVAFAQHDWPLTESYPQNGTSGSPVPLSTAETGLLCNPNPNVNLSGRSSIALGIAAEQGPFSDDGAYYRAAIGFQALPLGPSRLRGVFAFATLTNGSVITIDVDDWDAPCRRPDPLAPHGAILSLASPPPPTGSDVIADDIVAGPFSAIAPPQPSAGTDDTNPYHVPVAFSNAYTDSPVSLEWFFPVAAPHRARAGFILSNSTVTGNHAPYLLGVPQLFSSGAPLATTGPQAVGYPSLVPTDTPFVDPSDTANPTEPNPIDRVPVFSLPAGIDDAGVVDAGPDGSSADLTFVQSVPGQTPGIRFAWEDPEVYVDQDWTVTYEGPLPGFFDNGGNPLIQASVYAYNALNATQTVEDGGALDYSAVWISDTGAYFCSKGIEDVAAGAQRAAAENNAASAASLPTFPSGFETQVGDFVQMTASIRAPTDPYWGLENVCWGALSPSPQQPEERAALCADTYGYPYGTQAPTAFSLQRDFPILEAHDDKLLIGRFGYVGGTPVAHAPGSTAWTVVGKDPSNAPFLALMQCCFSNQVQFNVRTGGQWAVVGSQNAFLHHIVATGTDARCAPSCEARDALLNGRAAPIRQPCPGQALPGINRDSVLAMRNPLFAFLVWDGLNQTACVNGSTPDAADSPPLRDMTWTFSTRGSFVPQLMSIAGTNSNVSPTAMYYIDSLGQLAVIDSASQGLILFDLDSVSEAHAPYF